MKHNIAPTLEPVTIGGWYARADGTVGLYVWAEGHLNLLVAVENWEAVKEYRATAGEWYLP